jgi:pimeloyl-ACP methyl ester carboxylesterase
MNREHVRFTSGGVECAAWHYPGTNGACLVMGSGLAVTKEPGTDPFAPRFQEAGFSVLAFDYRRFGESGGEPRQVMRIADGEADFRAAVAFARTLPEVDPQRVAIWGFSLSAAHVFAVAADEPGLGAAIAVGAPADGRAITPNALRHTTPLSLARTLWRAATGGMVPLAGERGEVAALTTPDSRNGTRALQAERYPEWRQEVSARSALSLGSYRPGRRAPEIACPLLVIASESDGVAPQAATIAAAERAPRGEVVTIRGGHYSAYLEGREQALGAQLEFLARVLGPVGQAEQREQPLGVEEEGEVGDLAVTNVGDDD